jgi:hypothetical protein
MRIRTILCAMAFCAIPFGAPAFQFDQGFWGSFPPLSLPVSTVFGDCGDPCIVRDNEGGTIAFFNSVAITLRQEKILLVIDGYCASACAIIADSLRPNVCITANAIFYFHLGTRTTPNHPSAHIPPVTSPEWYTMIKSGEITVRRFPVTQSPDILAWIDERGGFPYGYYLHDMLRMSAQQASQFWPICGPEVQVLPRLRPEWPATPRTRPPRT